MGRLRHAVDHTAGAHAAPRMAENAIYGQKPGRPDAVTGSVSGTQVSVNVSHGGRSTSFSAGVSLPPGGTGPYPAIIMLGGFGALNSQILNSEGIATISSDPYAVGAEGTGRQNKQGAFYDIYGSSSSTGLLAAWAWGASRIIDVIAEQAGVVDAGAIGVTGCSRFGKGAFAVGAFDQRIALTVPMESGSGGVRIYRNLTAEGAQSPSSVYGEQPWLGDAFSAFTGNVNGLPVDTHEIVAMIAPRGLLILDNPHIANLGPRSAHVAALAGAEVYRALGALGNIAYHSNAQDGSHCAWRSEWDTPLRDAIRRHLTHAGGAAGVITAHPSATGNLAAWRTWTTPTLE